MTLKKRPAPKKSTKVDNLNVVTPDTNSRWNALLMGVSGGGKSEFIASCPNPLVFNFDPNTKTLEGRGFPILAYNHTNLSQFIEIVLPFLQRRRASEFVRENVPGFEHYTVETIALDSWTFCAKAVAEKAERQASDNKREFFNLYLTNLRKIAGFLAYLHQDRPGRESYYHVGTVHERAVYEKDNLVRFDPTLMGQFSGEVFQLYDEVLKARVETVREGGKAKRKGYLECYPTSLYPNLKDCVGGNSKTHNPLPPKVPNDFASLLRAWGMEEKSNLGVTPTDTEERQSES